MTYRSKGKTQRVKRYPQKRDTDHKQRPKQTLDNALDLQLSQSTLEITPQLLSNTRLSPAQRQLTANEIGVAHGNNVFQRYIRSGSVVHGRNVVIQRDFFDWLGGESASEAHARWTKESQQQERRNRELADDGTRWRVFFTKGQQSGANVIYEYEAGKRRNALTYANQPGRNYYKPGDIILTREVEQNELLQQFPELNNRQEEQNSWLNILTDIFGDTPTYKVGFKIIQISADDGDTGRGGVVCKGVILMPDTLVELQSTRTWTRDQLADSFVMSDMIPALDYLQSGIKVTAELAQFALGGELKSIAKGVGSRLISVGAQQLIQRIVKKLIFQVTLAITGEFAKSIANDIATHYLEQRIRLGKQSEQSLDLSEVIAKAGTSAAIAGISKGMSKGIEKYIKKLYKIDPVLGATMPQRIEKYLAEKIPDVLVVKKFEHLTKLTEKTIIDSQNNAGNLSELLEKNILDELKQWRNDEIKGLAEGFIETLSELSE